MLSFVSSVSACREDFLCAELSLNNILPIQPNLHIINKKCSTFLVRPVRTQIDFSRCLVCFHWAILRFLSDLTSLCHHSSPLFSASSKWTCPSLTTTLSTSPPPWWPWFVPLWRSNWPQVKHTETHHTLVEVANWIRISDSQPGVHVPQRPGEWGNTSLTSLKPGVWGKQHI